MLEKIQLWVLWDAAKAVLRDKFMTVNANIIKEEKAQLNSLDFYLQNLEKKEKTKPKLRSKGIIKNRKIDRILVKIYMNSEQPK